MKDIVAAIGTVVLATVLIAPASAQTSGGSRATKAAPAASQASGASSCEKLSGKNRDECRAQVRRDDAERGVTASTSSRSEAAPQGSTGTGASGTGSERSGARSGSSR